MLDIRSGERDINQLTLGQCKPLALSSHEQLEAFARRYTSLAIPKSNLGSFLSHLTVRQDAWFVEAGDVGLIYFTSLVPRQWADLNVMFWDGRLGKERREIIRSVIATAMALFALTRVQAVVPSANTALAVTMKKVGFTLEGTLRKAWNDGTTNQDLLIFGLLKEERDNWPSLPLMTIVQ